jgi:hypothetical protein
MHQSGSDQEGLGELRLYDLSGAPLTYVLHIYKLLISPADFDHVASML